MGYALCHSTCYGCKRVFSYNPMRVPSIRIDGVREPICRDCVERVNPLRELRGLPPIELFPDAYEPCDESELP
jgi:hypothetical protein